MAKKQYKKIEEIDQKEIEIMINGIMNYLYNFHSKKFENYNSFTDFVENFTKPALIIAECEYLKSTRQNFQLNSLHSGNVKETIKEYTKNKKQNESDESIDMPI